MSNITQISKDDMEEIDRMFQTVINDAKYCAEMMKENTLTAGDKIAKTNEMYDCLLHLHYYIATKYRHVTGSKLMSDLIEECIEMCHYRDMSSSKPSVTEYMRIHGICASIYPLIYDTSDI